MTQVSKRALLAGNTGAGCMHRLMTTPRISQAARLLGQLLPLEDHGASITPSGLTVTPRKAVI